MRILDSIVRVLMLFPDLLRYYLECYKYKKLDYFNFKKLASSFNFNRQIPLVSTNLLYGNHKALKFLTNGKFSVLSDYHEHGIVFSENLGVLERNDGLYLKVSRKIYTYSNRRKRIIKEKSIAYVSRDLSIEIVGPYILGAKNFKSIDELKELKENYGKMLLVFPMHSIQGVKGMYNKQLFIDAILAVRDRFDSVFICFHRLDIIDGQYKEFLNCGFNFVTAGSPNDPMFLSRLKDLIDLSDVTMSNSLGTHIGYSICLNKPHYFFLQDVGHTITGKTSKFQSSYEKDENAKKKELATTFAKYFGSFSYEITKKQIEIVKEYWGEWDY